MSIKKAYKIWSEQYDTNKNKTRDLDKKATINTLSNYNFENVLELGSGTGKNTLWLLENATSVICMDFSQEMLHKAKEKISSEKVIFKQVDLKDAWSIKNGSIDLITCSLTLEHLENLESVFNQAYDKLKPKGIFFISELHPFKQYMGSKARYQDEKGMHELEIYTHPISEYTKIAKSTLIEIDEWFDNEENSQNEIPRLITFVFKK